MSNYPRISRINLSSLTFKKKIFNDSKIYISLLLLKFQKNIFFNNLCLLSCDDMVVKYRLPSQDAAWVSSAHKYGHEEAVPWPHGEIKAAAVQQTGTQISHS